MSGIIDRFMIRRAARRVARIARDAGRLDLADLRRMRSVMRGMKRQIDRFLFTADERLALPLLGSNAFHRPLHTDWAYRPEAFRGRIDPMGIVSAQSRMTLGDEVTLFHDCQAGETIVRQLRNTREQDLAPFGLKLEVFRFGGSFLSLAFDLPPAAIDGLERRHLIRLDTQVEMERRIEIFARLNVQHGPNTEQLVRELPLHEDDVFVEFDLAYSKLNEKRVERAWVDLIFESPAMNQVILRDATFSRRPRADL